MPDIVVDLCHAPPRPNILSQGNVDAIASIIRAAKAVQSAKQPAKAWADRITNQIIIQLLETPGGLTRRDLLTIAETDNISSIIIRIRNKLRASNQYRLNKNGSGDDTLYFLIEN